MSVRSNFTMIATALTFALAGVHAEARVVTGFGSFKVFGMGNYPTNPYTCLAENNGAVVNMCRFNVNLAFDLPIDNTGTHWMTVGSYRGGPFVSFTCTPYEYNGTGPGTPGVGGTFWATNYPPGESPYIADTGILPNVNTPNGGESIQLICWNVPVGAGIAFINWTQ